MEVEGELEAPAGQLDATASGGDCKERRRRRDWAASRLGVRTAGGEVAPEGRRRDWVAARSIGTSR